MGLRCLLGHDFDEPELRREREEDGEEVVITVREEKTCSRCGYTKTVSENKEVTSIEQLAQTAGSSEAMSADTAAAAGGAGTTAPATDAGTTTAASQTETATAASDATATPSIDDTDAATANHDTEAATPGSDQPAADTHAEADPEEDVTDDNDAELLGETNEPAAESTPERTAESTEPSTASQEADDEDESVDATTDDGIILSTADDESGEMSTEGTSEREPGEWPEHDTDSSTTEHEWPEQSGDDEGYDAETPADEQSEDVTFGGGFTPEVDAKAVDSETDDNEVIEEPVDKEFTKAGEASLYEPTVDDINTEFYCPECGLSRHAGESSMRAGDICPECRRGYIAEQEL